LLEANIAYAGVLHLRHAASMKTTVLMWVSLQSLVQDIPKTYLAKGAGSSIQIFWRIERVLVAKRAPLMESLGSTCLKTTILCFWTRVHYRV
jgi:hypothetical protein